MLKLSALLLVLCSIPAFAQPPAVLDNKAIIDMLDRNTSRELVLAAINSAPRVNFTFLTSDYAEFTRVKLGPELLAAMYARQQAAGMVSATTSTAAGRATTATQTAPSANTDDDYLSAGSNEIVVNGSITVPHSDASAVNANLNVAYLRYLTSWFSIGPAFSGQFFSSTAHALGVGGGAQFSPRIGERVYWLAGAAPGVINTRVSRVGTDTRFFATAWTGPRVFLAKNVALDVNYRLTYIYLNGGGFKYSTASTVSVGLAFVFK